MDMMDIMLVGMALLAFHSLLISSARKYNHENSPEDDEALRIEKHTSI